MDLDDQFDLDHLFLSERTCRVCGKTKDLIDGFYLTRKDRRHIPSAYSYECKECTIKRIVVSRVTSRVLNKWEYPDW
jgi:hypothetical protein